MTEQIELQGIIDMGTAENPNCSGITMAQMELVDWELVDLSEWIAMADYANIIPDPTTITVDSLTGTSSFTDPGSVGKTNVFDRTTQRMTEPDYDTTFENATKGAAAAIVPTDVPPTP